MAGEGDHHFLTRPPFFKNLSSQRRVLHGGLVPVDPVTPDVHQSCSKRAFDGQVRKWRRMLHAWDPPGAEGDADATADPTTTLASPGGTKRGASARTPATAGRRKQGRTDGGKEEGKEGVPAAPAFDEGDWVDAAAEVGP